MSSVSIHSRPRRGGRYVDAPVVVRLRCVSIHSRPRRGGRSRLLEDHLGACAFQSTPAREGAGDESPKPLSGTPSTFQSTPAREGAGDFQLFRLHHGPTKFQSTPAREGAGDKMINDAIDYIKGFNPLPPAKGREIVRSAGQAVRRSVSIHSRPRRGGRSLLALVPDVVLRVSIHSRPRRGGRFATSFAAPRYGVFQSTPAREGAGDGPRRSSGSQESCFNPLPPAKGREISHRASCPRECAVSIHSRPRRGGRWFSLLSSGLIK